jgi:hypothetical protein
MSLSSFSPQVPCPGTTFPPPGPMGLVPRLHRYYWVLRLQHALPASLRFLRLAVPLRCSSFRSRRRRNTAANGPGDWSRRPFLAGFFFKETCWPPRFQLLRRAKPPSPYRVTPYCLPTKLRRRPPQSFAFRSSITQPAKLAVYASQMPSRAPTQDSLPVCRLGFDWTGLPPAGFQFLISSRCFHLLSQRTKLCLAHSHPRCKESRVVGVRAAGGRKAIPQ